MKISVLVDNSAKRNSNVFAEHGLSLHIACSGSNFLFDTGATDLYIKNAENMNVDLSKIDCIVFSHNHYDHTGGLKYFPNKVKVVAQKYAFYSRMNYKNNLAELDKRFKVVAVDSEPLELSENFIFLAKVPRINDFEGKKNFGKLLLPSQEIVDDFCEDDSALIYKSLDGIIIITGCSHSGICNITQYAQSVVEKKWGLSKIKAIIGGFHLINASEELLKRIAIILKNCGVEEVYPCHCTDLQAKIALALNGLHVNEVAAGIILEFA